MPPTDAQRRARDKWLNMPTENYTLTVSRPTP